MLYNYPYNFSCNFFWSEALKNIEPVHPDGMERTFLLTYTYLKTKAGIVNQEKTSDIY